MTSDIAKVRDKLQSIPRGLDKVMTRTANKVAQGARTDATKIIAGMVNLKQKDIRKDLTVRRATWKNQAAALEGSGPRGVGLEKYNPTPKPGAKRRPKGGLRVKVLKKGMPKTAKGTFYMPVSKGSRKYIVMERLGKRRGDIYRAFGPGMMTYYRRPSTLRRIRRRMTKRLHTELPRQVRGVLAQGGKL